MYTVSRTEAAYSKFFFKSSFVMSSFSNRRAIIRNLKTHKSNSNNEKCENETGTHESGPT